MAISERALRVSSDWDEIVREVILLRHLHSVSETAIDRVVLIMQDAVRNVQTALTTSDVADETVRKRAFAKAFAVCEQLKSSYQRKSWISVNISKPVRCLWVPRVSLFRTLSMHVCASLSRILLFSVCLVSLQNP